MSTLDLNNPKFPVWETEPDDSEKHLETDDEAIKTNVKDYEHPLFSSTGVVSLINNHRNLSNTKEPEISGEVDDKVFEDLSKAAKNTKFPYVLLLVCCDWDEDLTSRSSASDANGIARKLTQSSLSLKSSLGREPTYAELFMRHATGSDSKVVQIYKKNVEKPEEIAVEDAGTKKDQFVMNKKRGEQKTQRRTNRELYDYFYKRCAQGKVHFKLFLGKDVNGN